VTKLNYLAQVSVDTSSHIITHIEAFHADKRDSQCLDTVVEKVTTSLAENGLQLQEIIADTNYSSTEALQSLERRGITGFIPSFGGYKPDRAGFTYDKEMTFITALKEEAEFLPLSKTPRNSKNLS
jgi:hypothetical protein